MKHLLVFLAIGWCGAIGQSFAQRISSFDFEQRGNGLYLQYDLADTDSRGAEYTISLTAYWKNQSYTPRSVSGALGKGQTAGTRKQIVWDVLADLPQGVQAELWFELTATNEQRPTLSTTVENIGAPGNFTTYTETINGISFKMLAISGGSFEMGSNDGDSDEKPIHEVSVSNFQLGETEVTQALWRAVMGQDPPELYFKGCDDCPVERVSWNDIQEFLQKLNSLTKKNYRLPTEAEWEYAAGGGSSTRTKYAGTNSESELGEYAWYDSNSGGKTHPVAKKRPNALGLYDMSGNVWEWCSDWKGDYPSGAQVNPKGPETGSYRVLRGGSWYDLAGLCRSAYRYNIIPSGRDGNRGFRLAL